METTKKGTSRGWKWLRRGLLGLAMLVTLFALFHAEEDIRGKHAFNKYRREQEARGEKFDLKDFIPPPVPDDQNFAMIPFLKPILEIDPVTHARLDSNGVKRIEDFGTNIYNTNSPGNRAFTWAGGVKPIQDSDWWEALTNSPSTKSPFANREEAAKTLLADLEEYKPVMDELQSASRLPYCRFNIDYTTYPPAAMLLPHLATVKKLSQLFNYRARAELTLGRTDAAAADLRMVFYLAGTMKDEPFCISGLVRCAILKIGLQTIETTFKNRQWTDAQLAELENVLAAPDLLKDYEAMMRGERALNLGNAEYLRHNGPNSFDEPGGNHLMPSLLIPSGFIYRNELLMARIFASYLAPADVQGHRVFASQVMSDAQLAKEITSGFLGYNFVARLMMPAYGRALQKFAIGQVNLDESQIACALERYRLANGKYPESMDTLSPKFIKSVPRDVFSGEPYQYRLKGDGQFVLYSIGWNEKDDGGITALRADKKAADMMQGDWVWGEMQ